MVGDAKTPGTVIELVQTSFLPIFLHTRGFLAVPDRVPIFEHDVPAPAAKTIGVESNIGNAVNAAHANARAVFLLIRSHYF